MTNPTDYDATLTELRSQLSRLQSSTLQLFIDTACDLKGKGLSNSQIVQAFAMNEPLAGLTLAGATFCLMNELEMRKAETK